MLTEYDCCCLQIRPVEEQLKQRVIGQRYCINRKKGSHTKEVLAVLGSQSVCQISHKKREVIFSERAKLGKYVWVGRVYLWGMVGYVPITMILTIWCQLLIL